MLDLGDLNRQAERILSDARVEADRIIADSRAEAEQLIDSADTVGHERGYERGLAEGREAGREEGRQEVLDTLKPQINELIAGWNKSLEQWETDREEMLLAAREDVLTFAFALAQKIILRAIEHDPSIVRDQLESALKMLTKPTAVSVRVHPEDKACIEDAMPNLLEQFAGCEHLGVREDDSISRGGCIVNTNGGQIDATIETQLARIAEALLPQDRTAPAQPERVPEPEINDQPDKSPQDDTPA